MSEFQPLRPKLPIRTVARRLGLHGREIECHGAHIAKVSPFVVERLHRRSPGKVLLVTAITPTPLGEGKTVTTIGLGMALNRIGERAVVCLRQPSLGPVFGIKGGASGGGRAQIVPSEEINLHFTGDVHAVALATNLAAAMLDNHIFHGNSLGIDVRRIHIHRVVDLSDRFLRRMTIGQKGEGGPRETGFDIAVASEVMAILALSVDYADLRRRLGAMILAETKRGRFVTAGEIGAAGAMAAILRDALKPNLVQTAEGTPCFVHCGPFGNIAHGNSSVLADLIAIRCAPWLVTEAGFAADMGAEKFIDIKCRVSGLRPSAAVVVCSIRALKSHSGRFRVVPGRPLDPALTSEDVDSLKAGLPNLEAHLEIVRGFGLPAVVAINRFPSDTRPEVEAVRDAARRAGANAAVVSEVFSRGGEGGRDLARAVVRAASRHSRVRFVYPLSASLPRKIEAVAKAVYGARGVRLSARARRGLEKYARHGFGRLPVCMAKTHLSISHDASKKGRPRGFVLPVKEVRLSAGAGFVVPICGVIGMMPGLPSKPRACAIDCDARGRITGLL
ncbi:MAG: formate--tetrahydrofolate ligase [Planctomycetes bacterium]|nr:formate--tetrahydrofolate ligase [Planctomycetota bacterium]